MHMFAAFYFIIVLAIENEWNFSYDELISLWTLGALLVGLGAIPAGWLSDKWSRSMMMFIMFFGMGISSIICGLSNHKLQLFIGLSFLGLFCSIYHPVGISWVINSYVKKGRALGINGIFGGVGIGFGAFIAGILVEFYGWKYAFIIPGIISVIVSFMLFLAIYLKFISFKNISSKTANEKHNSSKLIFVVIIMLIIMFGLGLSFQILQTSIPKVLDIRIDNINTYKIGLIVALIYGTAGITTLIGGLLADKFPLKIIYLIGIFAQAPCFYFISTFYGLPLIIITLIAVVFNSSILPTENILLAKFTPEKYHGLIYGVKFIVAFGTGPIAVYIIAKTYEITHEFSYLFLFSSTILFFIGSLAIFLPIKNIKIITS